MRTLIVEDDFTSRLVLQSFLSEYGECHIAVNGREAVAAFRAAQERGQAYDLICMDVMMPEMDGQTALREIRALEEAAGTLSTKRVKIIMTTALNDTKNVVESLKGSCDAYLIKPIHKKELFGHIRDFLPRLVDDP
jgi:two-component system chemotaxis response regulator CheY